MSDYVELNNINLVAADSILEYLESTEFIIGIYKGIYIVTFWENANKFILYIFCTDLLCCVFLDNTKDIALAEKSLTSKMLAQISTTEYLETLTSASNLIKSLQDV